MASRTPPLLEPYLGLPPEASLIVLTGVLGASTNWLVQRYLCGFLATASAADRNAQRAAVGEQGDGSSPDDGESVSVVLVSFLRDYAFWKEGAGRIGVDLDASSKKGKFVFVDGLSRLFSGGATAPGASPVDAGGKVLSNSTLQELRKQLTEAVTQLRQQSQSSKIVLILDSPDLLLVAAGKAVTGAPLQDLLLDIREVSLCKLTARSRTSIDRTIVIGSPFVHRHTCSRRASAFGPDHHLGKGACCFFHFIRSCGRYDNQPEDA